MGSGEGTECGVGKENVDIGQRVECGVYEKPFLPLLKKINVFCSLVPFMCISVKLGTSADWVCSLLWFRSQFHC